MPVASARDPLALSTSASSSASVVCASAMLARADSMVAFVSSMVPERSSSEPSTSWMRVTTLSVVVFASPRTPLEAPLSLSTTTPVTVFTKVSLIWVSIVEAPVSVTLGAMGLTFSLT